MSELEIHVFFTKWRNILVLRLTKRCQRCLEIATIRAEHRFAKMSTRRWWAIIPRALNLFRLYDLVFTFHLWMNCSPVSPSHVHKTWPEIAGVPKSMQISRWFKRRSEKNWSWTPLFEHLGPIFLSQIKLTASCIAAWKCCSARCRSVAPPSRKTYTAKAWKPRRSIDSKP